MTLGLQIILATVAISTSFVILRGIRKSNFQIEDSFFWLLFSLVLLLFAVFPAVIVYLAKMLGFLSPANFVFLVIIFLLIVNQYRLTKKLSKNEIKLKNLIQHTALLEFEQKKNKND